jgi:uncharacterized membrane protein YfcA
MFIENSLMANYLYIALGVLFVASFVAGYIDSIAGGAGLILLPALLLTGFPPQLALGQEKLIGTLGTIGAIRNFVKNKSVIWKIVPLGIASALIGAYIGTRAILILPTETLYYIILGLIPFGLCFTLFKATMKNKNHFVETINYSWSAVVITCLLVGFYDGFFGPGAGSIFIICLYVVNKMPLLNASATSKIFNFSSNLGSFVGFAIAGKMVFLTGIPMIIGCFLGNHFGSLHAIKTDGKIIKKALILTVGIMMITLIIKLI